MKKRIIPLFFLVLLLATVMIPTSAAISTKAISGKPTLKIEGTIAETATMQFRLQLH